MAASAKHHLIHYPVVAGLHHCWLQIHPAPIYIFLHDERRYRTVANRHDSCRANARLAPNARSKPQPLHLESQAGNLAGTASKRPAQIAAKTHRLSSRCYFRAEKHAKILRLAPHAHPLPTIPGKDAGSGRSCNADCCCFLPAGRASHSARSERRLLAEPLRSSCRLARMTVQRLPHLSGSGHHRFCSSSYRHFVLYSEHQFA